MNRKTLERLQSNPHYKISAQQYAEPMDEDREPMVEFGKIPSNMLPSKTNNTKMVRVERKQR